MFEDDIFEEEFFPTCDIYVAENSDESDFDEDDIKMMEELERVSTMLLILITFQIMKSYIHFRLRAQAQIQVMVKVINRIQDVCSMK